jgi:hypothetical protein
MIPLESRQKIRALRSALSLLQVDNINLLFALSFQALAAERSRACEQRQSWLKAA